jgi:membrane-bound lytic murein transglycosylase B
MSLALTRSPQIAAAITTGLMALRRPRNCAVLQGAAARVVYMRPIIRFSGLIICLLWRAPVEAASCRDSAGFEAWLASFKREAAAQGIPPSAITP